MKALIVPDIDGDPGHQPGAIEFRRWADDDSFGGLAFRCPCGCGREGYLPFEQDKRGPGGPSWRWDGNEAAPTMEPSVLFRGGCCWHGWLRNGEWVTA